MRRIFIILVCLFGFHLLCDGCGGAKVRQTPDRESVKQRSGQEFQVMDEEE
jgi:hypothetical protein